jgi:hypothetical protein
VRITLDPALFEDSRRSFDLKRLFFAAVERPHQILIGHPERDRKVFEKWLDDQQPDMRERFEQLVDHPDPELTRFPPDVRVRVTQAEPERVDEDGRRATASLRRAIDLVGSPLRLVLENGVNDAAFLRKVAPPGEFRDWLAHAKAREWIDPINGGGSSLGSLLVSFSPWQRLRSWALCDAETWLPKSISGTEHHQVRGFRKAADHSPRVPLQVLERRAIENYLPMPALKKWAFQWPRKGTSREERQLRSAFVEALAPLDAQRARFPLRHHYHLERGFEAAEDEIPPDYVAFRKDAALAKGAGHKVKMIWASTHQDQPGLAADWLQDEWLAADGQRAEIQRIIDSIRRRL